LIGRATTNLASGIHHEAYDCDNHNEAAEYAAKLEAGLLPSNINVLIFDHLVSAVEHECGMVRALGGVDSEGFPFRSKSDSRLLFGRQSWV
jgi:hypothetical protein